MTFNQSHFVANGAVNNGNNFNRLTLESLKSADPYPIELTDYPNLNKQIIEESQKRPNLIEKFKNYYNNYSNVIFYSFLIALGGLLYGYDLGIIGGLINLPKFQNEFGNIKLDNLKNTISDLYIGIIVGSSCIGGAIGSLCTIYIVPLFGIKMSIVIPCFIYMIGSIICITSNTKWVQFIIGRFFIGICLGIICVTCPMLISEISPTHIRGTLISIQQLMITIGILLGGIILYIVNDSINTEWQYKLPILIGCLISVVCFTIVNRVPESPYWWILYRENISNAKFTIAKCNKIKNVNDERILKIIREIIELRDDIMMKSNSNSILKGEPKFLIRTITGIFLNIFQQLTGINFFFFYGSKIFISFGLRNPYIVSIIFGLVNFSFSILSVLIIDKFKRKNLLQFGSFILFLLMIIFVVIGINNENINPNISSIIIAISSSIFIGIFSITWGPLTGILISEIYPISIKIKAMSICGFVGWITTFLISIFIPFIMSLIGISVCIIFAISLILSIFFINFFIPETKNIPINEINNLFI